MKINQNTYRRLKTLEFNLNEIDLAYNDLLKDYVLEVGIEYDTTYPDNKETHLLFKKAKDLYQLRKDKLFSAVFSFTQTFYSLKEYLIAQSPEKEVTIENFFSNEKKNSISRKSISNDLKHNPSEDLKFDARVVKTEIIKEPGKETHISYMRHSWFYGKIETVEYCRELYNELLDFMKQTFT